MKRKVCALAAALAALLLLPAALPAQDSWLPISPDDLALKDNPASPGADAMILYRENIVDASNVNVDGDNNREYFRIKVFTQAGTKRATVEIPFFADSMHVEHIQGRTIRPDGSIVKFDGKVLETTIAKLSGMKYLAKTFTLPDAQPGCIIEYKYTRQGRPNYLHDLEWVVSQDIFTREAHFIMKPSPYATGYYPYRRVYNLPPDAAMTQDKPGVYSMTVHNVPPVIDEALMPSAETLQSRVEFFYRDDDVEEAPAKFWPREAKKWNGEFEHFIDKKDVLQSVVSKTIDPSDPPETKLEKLYVRAQQVRNLNEEDSKTQKELKNESIKPNSNVADLVSHGYGYGREINFFFAGLARTAGFQAQEVRIAPANGQPFNPAGEDVRQLDDDLVWVSTGVKEYYLDPAAHFFPFNLLPWYEQAARGLRLDKPTELIMTSSMNETTAIVARHAELAIGADGGVTGKISIDIGGQDAALLRVENRLEDEAGQKKNMEEMVKEWLPSTATFTVTSAGPWDQNTVPLHVEGTISISGLAVSAGTRLLFPADIFQTRNAGAFASEKRVNVIDFHYPYEENDDMKLTPPPGYLIGAPPKPISMNAGAVVYSLDFTQSGDVFEAKRQFSMKGSMFESKYYASIRNIFGNIRSNDDTQILMQAKPVGAN